MKKLIATMAFAILIAAFNTGISAQEIKPKPASDQLFTLGKYYYDQEKYERSEELLQKIHPGDTNYVESLRMLAWICLESNRTDSAMDYVDRAMQEPLDDPTQLIYLKAAIYKQSGKTSEALEFLQQETGKYPYAASLHWLVADINQSKLDYEKAEAAMIEAVKLSPYNPAYHFKLAVITMCRSRVVPAMLIMSVAVNLRSPGKQAATDMTIFNHICSGEYPELFKETDYKVFEEETNRDYARIGRMINSGFAMRAGFKTKFKYKHPFVANTELLLSELRKIKPENDFYSSFYLPLLIELQDKKQLPAFFSNALENAGEPDFLNWSEKKAKQYQAFERAFRGFVNARREIMFAVPGTETLWYEYSDNGKVSAVGKRKDTKPDGAWILYYDTGVKKAELSFSNNVVEGIVVGYNSYGDTLSVTEFSNGKRNGLQKDYYPNGVLFQQVYNKDDKRDGEYLEYHISGQLHVKGQYSNGLKTGNWAEYFPNGSVEKEYSYNSDGKLHGIYRDYFENRQLYVECSYSNGDYEGQFTGYNANGKLRRVGLAKSNKMVGVWKFYNKTGGLDSEEHYNDDLKEVKNIEYHSNGNIATEIFFDDTEQIRQVKYYTNEGLLWYELQFENDIPQVFIRYNEKGDVVETIKGNGKTLSYTLYRNNGSKSSDGRLAKGGKDGIWKYYSIHGNLSTEENYKGGMLEGKVLRYNMDGKIVSYSPYKEGERDGNHMLFNDEGLLIQDLYYKNNSRAGVTTEYFNNGNIEERYYHFEDDYNGPYEFFDVDGKPLRTDFYRYGYRYAIVYYDTAGKVMSQTEFPNGNGTVKMFNPKGTLMIECTFLKGDRHGDYTIYNSDGVKRYHGSFLHGSEWGRHEWYHPNGRLQYECEYINGGKHGISKSYNPLGHLTQKESHILGVSHDTTLYYWHNGNVYCTEVYQNGNLTGYLSYHGLDGEPILRLKVDNGLFVAYSFKKEDGNFCEDIPFSGDSMLIQTRYPNGKIACEFGVKGGWYHGPNRIYSPNGILMKESFTVHGKSHGLLRYFYTDGKLLLEAPLQQNEFHGVMKYYDPKGKLVFETSYAFGDRHGKSVLYDAAGKPIKTWVFRSNVCMDYNTSAK